MPAKKRFSTQYPGVYFIEGTAVGNCKTEKIFYIRYRRDGKLIEEKAGRQFQDDMTPAKASRLRTLRINGDQPSNEEIRLDAEKERLKDQNCWTITRLWEDYKTNKPDMKSIRSDNYMFKKHIEPAFGAKEVKDIAPFDVDRLRLNLSKSKAPQTVSYILKLLKRTVHHGVKRQYCQPLAFEIEMPIVNNQKTEDLTPEQLKCLMVAIGADENIQAGNMMKLALYTGMRRGEMFRLKWEDIDNERGFIHIRNPKGGVDQKIPLNNAAKELLRNHPREGSAFVFPGRGGLQRTDIKKQVNRIKERAGLPKDFRALHGLRHVYASMLASSGQVDMYTLQKLLTHKSPQMTQRYAHLRDETLKRAADLAGDIINLALTANSDKRAVEKK